MVGIGNNILKITKIIDRLFISFSKVVVTIAGVILMGVTLMINSGVLIRTLTDWTIVFVEEWAALALIPMSYLVFGYVLRCDRHLKMDLVVRSVPNRIKGVLAIFSGTFGLVVTWFILKSAYNSLMYTWTRNVASSGPMRTPLWIPNIFVMIGVSLLAADMVLFLLNHIIHILSGKKSFHFDDVKDEEVTVENIKGEATCK